MTSDLEVPRTMRVPCFNSSDGCLNVVSYTGVGPVRKICPVCMESGTPSERTNTGGDFGRSARKLKIPKGFYDAEAVFEVTVWPRTFHGGRVTPCSVND